MDNEQKINEILNSFSNMQQAKPTLTFSNSWQQIQMRKASKDKAFVRLLWAVAASLLLFTGLNVASYFLKNKAEKNRVEIENFAREYGFTKEVNS